MGDEWDVLEVSPGRLIGAIRNNNPRTDGSPILDGGYPASVEVGPRERLIVDYEIRPSSRRIVGRFVTFPEDW
ncbi:MAG: hypothetical protein ACUVYA_01595 [Planctomycetota bacterium]